MGQKSTTTALKKKRKIFGWVFALSTLVFFASNMVFTLSPMEPLPEPSPPINHGPTSGGGGTGGGGGSGGGGGNQPPDNNPPFQPTNSNGIDTAVAVSLVSLLTSLTSLIGFFSTTLLAWRKEKRETIAAGIELQKKELELEKLRMEVKKSGNQNE
jgi:uncharacterized membrane protein YfcA